MTHCMVLWCKNKGRIPGLSYFRLTKRRHDDWLIALGRDPTREHLSTSNMVCSDHFSEEHKMYFSKKSFRLKCNAVPTLRLKRRNILDEKEIYCNRHYMTVSSRNILSSAWESSSRATKQDKTNKLLSPSNSHIKSEEIEIDEIKLDTIDTQNEYNISNTIYLSNFYGVKTECKDPIKSETEIKVLSETVHNIKQEIDIKCEEIEIGGIKVEPLDPADDYYFLNN